MSLTRRARARWYGVSMTVLWAFSIVAVLAAMSVYAIALVNGSLPWWLSPSTLILAGISCFGLFLAGVAFLAAYEEHRNAYLRKHPESPAAAGTRDDEKKE